MLQHEGVTVDYEAPQERRGAGEVAQNVVINLVCDGAFAAIVASVHRFRASRFGPSAEVEAPESSSGDAQD